MIVRVRRALLSVTKKDEIVSLAQGLLKHGVEIIATGGTAQKLGEAGIPFTPIEKITGNPEAFGGRMKTLSFAFLSALLYRRGNPQDEAQAKVLGIEAVDLVACNFYPFAEASAAKVTDPELIENIDIGGPSMVRAAAKNFNAVVVCTDPSQYKTLLAQMDIHNGGTNVDFRQSLAEQAFLLTARYDTAIASELSRRFSGDERRFVELSQGKGLRYGENPHQAAKFFTLPKAEGTLATAEILQGKQLSYNNLLDADAAHRASSDVARLKQGGCAVAVVKHLNPCGLAWAPSPLEALELAWAGDPISAFGGILSFSAPIGLDVVRWLDSKFIEIVIAPEITAEARGVLEAKKNLRVLLLPKAEAKGEEVWRSVSGGLLIQDEDRWELEALDSVTQEKFLDTEIQLGQFGVIAAKHLRSNAIALVRVVGNALQLAGAGMGQPNRLDSLRLLAAPRAREKCELGHCILVSDAFFPFPDVVELSHELGIRAIVQPGGSIKDKEVIATCDRLGIRMAFTGKRHFRH